MAITVLGAVTVDGTDVNGRRDRIVLAVLASRLGHAVPSDTVTDALWGDQPPPSAAKNMQGCVVRLRRLLGPDAITTTSLGYSLEVPADEVDAWRFERLVSRARELLALGEPDRAAYQLGEALALWRGAPFLDLESWHPAAPEVRRLGELHLEAEELKAQAELAAGRVGEVLATCQTLVREAPLREQRWALLARAQYQAGQQAEALRTIHQLKGVLSRQLGIDPSPDVMALEQAVLQQDPSLAVPEQLGDELAACPWQGLRPYDVQDADWFFGRDRDVTACLEILGVQRLLALAGPSGSGKSSLLRAGVGSALRARGHRLVTITPGTRPMEALGVLHGAEPRTVLLVDQAEEAFTLCQDEDERLLFLDSLVDEAERRTVVVALRADRLSDVALHSAFSRLVERGLYLVGGLDQDGLRATIETPARQAGLLVEPGLVDLLVAEVARDPGALPLLSHALLETWQRREGRTLTAAGYRDSGGIQGAVAKSAERLYAALDPDERPHLRDVMLRLVIPDDEGDPVRAKVPRRLLDREEGRDELVERLVAARLVTTDAGMVAISHEALARAWPRLRTWLDDDVDGQRILHHLAATADGWNTLGRPDTELYRGVRLARALAWTDQHAASLNPVETDFLDASRDAEEVAERSAAEHGRRQTILIRRLRLVLGGAVVLLVLAVVSGLLAAHQADQAEENAASAVEAQTRSDARAAGARALLTDDIGSSMLLAVAGVRLDDSPATRSSLLATLGRHPALIESMPMVGETVLRFDVSPDGSRVATVDEAFRVRLYEIDSGELVHEFQAGSDDPLSWISGDIAFSPDGNTLAVMTAAPTSQPVMLLHADTLEPLDAQPGGLGAWRWQVHDLAYSRDGRVLAAVIARVQGSAGTTRRTSSWAVVWGSSDAQNPVRRIRLPGDGFDLALSPDGRVLYTSSPLMRHDLTAGTSSLMSDPGVYPLETSPDGTLLAAAGEAKGVLLLDSRTGEVRRELPTGSQAPWLVRFSRDGLLVATTTVGNQEALVWAVSTGEVRARIPLGEWVEEVAFSPDGSALFTAGGDSTLRKWDLDGSQQFLPREAAAAVHYQYRRVIAPGGDFVAYQSDTAVRFLEVGSGSLGARLGEAPSGPPPVVGSWDPAGSRFAVPNGDQVTIWDARTSAIVSQGRPVSTDAAAIDFNADGTGLVVADLSGAVVIVEPATLEPLGTHLQVDGVPCAVSLAPDNRTAFVATGVPKTAWQFWNVNCSDWSLVDLESGAVLDGGTVDLQGGITAVDFSPEGDRVAIISGQNLVALDVSTGLPLWPPVVAHDDSIFSVAYSPDATRILTAGSDASAALWDAETGRLVARVATPGLLSVAQFLDDGRSVLIADGYEGSVYRWDTRPGYAVDFACHVAGRDITKAEWSAQFGDRPFQEVCPG
jgi:WD40 repeat protein/DNA-binding SARP family transcriptional activator